MILLYMTILGPLLLIAGLSLLQDRREALAPLFAGVLMTASWTLGFYLPDFPISSILWMVLPGVAGVILLFQAVRTRLGLIVGGLYTAGGLACLAPTLIFTFLLYAIHPKS